MTNHYFTTTNPAGQAIFSPTVPSEAHKIPTAPSGDIEDGYIQVLSWLESNPPDLSTEDDLDLYSRIRTQGISGQVCPPNGASTLLLVLGPGKDGASMHTTLTLDVCMVLEGVAELVLDSGETKTLNVGDTVVQRATAHSWKNVTPDGGSMKLLAHVLSAKKQGS